MWIFAQLSLGVSHMQSRNTIVPHAPSQMEARRLLKVIDCSKESKAESHAFWLFHAVMASKEIGSKETAVVSDTHLHPCHGINPVGIADPAGKQDARKVHVRSINIGNWAISVSTSYNCSPSADG